MVNRTSHNYQIYALFQCPHTFSIPVNFSIIFPYIFFNFPCTISISKHFFQFPHTISISTDYFNFDALSQFLIFNYISISIFQFPHIISISTQYFIFRALFQFTCTISIYMHYFNFHTLL